jgi:ribosomal protein S6
MAGFCFQKRIQTKNLSYRIEKSRLVLYFVIYLQITIQNIETITH